MPEPAEVAEHGHGKGGERGQCSRFKSLLGNLASTATKINVPGIVEANCQINSSGAGSHSYSLEK